MAETDIPLTKTDIVGNYEFHCRKMPGRFCLVWFVVTCDIGTWADVTIATGIPSTWYQLIGTAINQIDGTCADIAVNGTSLILNARGNAAGGTWWRGTGIFRY